MREGRYDAVFHLVTAAQGAERFYTLENNQARSETPQQVREVEKGGGILHLYVVSMLLRHSGCVSREWTRLLQLPLSDAEAVT